jgi:hypothetical protein
LRLALLNIVASWIIVLAGTAACVLISHSLPAAITTWHRFASVYPGWRAPAICVLACVLMPALSFRFFTDTFPFMLTGRKSVSDAAAWSILMLLVGLISAAVWLVNHRDWLPLLLRVAPWVVATLAIVKISAAAVVFRMVLRRGLFGWAEFSRLVACWVVLTGLAFVLVTLLDPPSALVWKPSLFLGIATFMPLVRFPVATLAFDWNRHQ